MLSPVLYTRAGGVAWARILSAVVSFSSSRYTFRRVASSCRRSSSSNASMRSTRAVRSANCSATTSTKVARFSLFALRLQPKSFSIDKMMTHNDFFVKQKKKQKNFTLHNENHLGGQCWVRTGAGGGFRVAPVSGECSYTKVMGLRPTGGQRRQSSALIISCLTRAFLKGSSAG